MTDDVRVETVRADRTGDLVERIAEAAEKAGFKAGESASVPQWAAETVLARLAEAGATTVNREVSRARVQSYADDMVTGLWLFHPDPIAVSEDGRLLNGQHRILAASLVADWGAYDEPPGFLVVWGVDRRVAAMIDEASRSARDRRRIAIGLAGA